MAGRIKIVAVALTGVLGIGILYTATSTATTISHLLAVMDCYGRVAILRVFEIAYRIYTLPL